MKRKIAAVMAADIAGYGQLVAEDAEETQRRLESYRAAFGDFVSRSSGRIVKAPGNAVIAEFLSAVEAVRCAIDVQESLRTRNLAYPPSRQMRFRIGITIGDVVEQAGDLLGDGVNVAARLEALAQPGGLCVSRAVYEQVVNKLSVKFIDIGEQEVQNLPTPVRAYTLTLGASGAAGTPERQSVGSRTIGIWPATIAAALVTAFATGAVLYFIAPQSSPAPAEPPVPAPVVQAAPPPPAQRRAEDLVPERVPFITDRQRLAIRNEYLPGPDHKALAISFLAGGFITDQADEETAKAAALDACQKNTDNINKLFRCEVYAVGSTVVSTRGRPPMPPVPWLIRDASIETPFVAKNVPFLDGNVRTVIEKFYQPARKPKALAVSAQGHQGFYNNQASADEAVRRSLEACGSRAGIACMIVAVDDVFVVPIPTTMKVVEFFRPGSNAAIAVEEREEVTRRIGNAPGGWNAVAVGASGRPGLGLSASNEQAATDGALAECGRLDRACHVIAIGPFAVEPLLLPSVGSCGEGDRVKPSTRLRQFLKRRAVIDHDQTALDGDDAVLLPGAQAPVDAFPCRADQFAEVAL
jgi:class 3 adenylate cyclase